MTPLEYAGYTMRAQDLLPLLPLLAVTATSIWVMLAIGVRRNYSFMLGSTVIGLLIAAGFALRLLSGPAAAPAPLLTMDAYAQFFTVVICALAIGLSLVSHDYWSEFDDHREEFFLLLILATLGAVVLAGANHFATLLLGVETLSMSLYGMLAYPVHSKRPANSHALESAVKYLILSAVSTAMILFGCGADLRADRQPRLRRARRSPRRAGNQLFRGRAAAGIGGSGFQALAVSVPHLDPGRL